MEKTVGTFFIVLVLLISGIPLAAAQGKDTTVAAQGRADQAPMISTGPRSVTEQNSQGGSWSEYFDKGTTGSVYRTTLLDNKVQLDVDPISFTKYYNNPVLGPNPGHFDSNGVRMNGILYENGTYRMWYGGTNDGTHYKVGYATSSDGRNWTRQNGSQPVLVPGPANSWDDDSVYGGPVIKDGNTYKMWYSGNDGALSKVGLATSTDGLTWVKNANNPVLKNSGVGGGAWDANHVGAGTVIKDNGVYKMWFAGNNGQGNNGDQIGYATSNNGVAWNKFANNPILALGGNGKYNSNTNLAPRVWKNGEWYDMIVSGYNGASFSAGAAESRDGTTWTMLNNGNPVVSNGGVGSWDQTGILEKSLVRLGNRNFLYYGGLSAAGSRIGLAVGSNFDTAGYIISEQIKLPDGMNWDQISIKTEEPAGTSIKLTVLNNITNKSINGYDNLTGPNIDLSKLDGSVQKAIRLMVIFSGTATASPGLFSWGVSWVNKTAFRDSFIGTGHMSIVDNSSIRLWDGALKLEDNPLVWWKDASNPVITYGSAGNWDQSKAGNATFMLYNGKQNLLYTGLSGTTDKIGLATANDFKTWTKDAGNPVVSPTGASWDQTLVRDPDIKELDRTVKLFYSGKGASNGIGYAYGTDLVNWNKYDKNPVLVPSGASWDSAEVKEPNVMRINGTWYMYYAGNASGVGYKIGYATSIDGGYYYVKPGSNKILDLGTSGKFDDQSVTSPSVVFDKDRFLMFYVGVDAGTGSGAIGLASSTDGKTWSRLNGGNPIISTGSGWDASHINSVTAAYVNSVYELYYSADGGDGKIQIGRATSGHLTSTSIVSKEIVLPGNGLWNSVYVNKNEPSGTYINVSVINATSGTVVPGFSDLTAGTINISTISFNSYPKLKLKATIQGDGKATPTLYDWSLNWTIAKVEQKTQIPDKSFLEEGSATNLYDLSTYFTHKRFGNKTLTYTIKTNSDPVNIDAKIEADGYHMSFNAPTINWTGSSQYTVNVSDNYMNLTSNQFTVSVLNVNDPPVWLKIPDKFITEDNPVDNLVDLTKFVVDCDTPLKDLVFTMTNHDPANMTVTLDANNNIDVSPGDNYTGTVKVTVMVNDGQYSASTIFNIIVNPINDKPVWTNFGPIQLIEDTPQVDIINLEAFVKDAETSQKDLTYTVSGDPTKVDATLSNAHKVSLYPATNFTGNMTLTFTVSDGQYTVPLSVMVIVSPVNDAPVWLHMPQYTILEDKKAVNLVNLDGYVVDAETLSKDLHYNVESVSEPSAIVTIDAKHNLTITPGENYFGTIIIEVSVSDGLLTTMTNITVIVTPVNDAPIITSTPITIATATELYQYQVTALDIENDPLTFSLTSFISGMSIDASSGLISWVPSAAQTGSFEVKLQVSDGQATATQDFFLDVSPKASGNNNPPVITSEPPKDAIVGDTYTYAVQAIDADKDPLTYSLSTRPTGMTMKSTTGVVDWVPQAGMEGPHPVVVAVSDGKVQVTQSFVITVFPKGTIINHPPVINSRPVTKIIAGSEYTYRVVATDADGDTLHYYLSLAPDNMTIDVNMGTVHWTPTAQDLGEQHIVIRVTDGRANASQAYSLQVSLGNHLPSMTSTPVTKATIGKPYKYQLTATDPDTSDKLLYGLKSGPTGMSVDPSTGLITWMPTKAGTEAVTVYVTDGIVQTNQTFSIKVTATKKPTGLDLANFPWWIIIVLVVVIVVILGLVLSRRRDKDAHMPSTQPPTYPPQQVEHHHPSPPRYSAPPVQKAPVAAPLVIHSEEVMQPDDTAEAPTLEERPEEKPTQKDGSTNDILDDILGKAPPAEKDGEPAKATAVAIKTVPKATAKPAETAAKTVIIEDKTYNQEQILHTLTSLPRGLPSTLWGMDMDELASELMIAEYSHNNSGDVIVKLGKKWYFGDPKELGNYLQHDKSQ